MPTDGSFAPRALIQAAEAGDGAAISLLHAGAHTNGMAQWQPQPPAPARPSTSSPASEAQRAQARMFLQNDPLLTQLRRISRHGGVDVSIADTPAALRSIAANNAGSRRRAKALRGGASAIVIDTVTRC